MPLNHLWSPHEPRFNHHPGQALLLSHLGCGMVLVSLCPGLFILQALTFLLHKPGAVYVASTCDSNVQLPLYQHDIHTQLSPCK